MGTFEKPDVLYYRIMQPQTAFSSWTDDRTRLQVGMVILIGGEKYRVDLVNYSRARCVPLRKKRVVFKPVCSARKVVFYKDSSAINISPNSDFKIIS